MEVTTNWLSKKELAAKWQQYTTQYLVLNRQDLYQRTSRVPSLRTWKCEDLKTTPIKTKCQQCLTSKQRPSCQQITSYHTYSTKVASTKFPRLKISSMSQVECLAAKLKLHIRALQQATGASLEVSLKGSWAVIMWALLINKLLSMGRWDSRGQWLARQTLWTTRLIKIRLRWLSGQQLLPLASLSTNLR